MTGSDEYFFGYFDTTKNRLIKEHICQVQVLGSIQVRESLYAYFTGGTSYSSGIPSWSSFTDFDKEAVVENTLKEPFFG